MALLQISDLRRSFGATQAVDSVSFTVPSGAFLALLGPSGCGKTTLLRLLAGLERPDSGTIAINGRQMVGQGVFVPPEERGLGMVFQSYALWPHMSVAGNIRFGLSLRKLPKPEQEARIEEALAMVGLSGMGGRRPHQLSGGQRQRVALARSLAMRPGLILLDEPLANLDAHLRGQMLAEFRRLHATTGTGFVFVTHDQDEAMAVATHVGVMQSGRLMQLAPPEELYRRPASAMVARFVGNGRTIPIEVLRQQGQHCVISLQGKDVSLQGQAPAGPAWLCLRPSNLTPAADGQLALRVVGSLFRAGSYNVTAEIEGLEQGGIVEFSASFAPKVGDLIRVALTGGWVLPREEMRPSVHKPTGLVLA